MSKHNKAKKPAVSAPTVKAEEKVKLTALQQLVSDVITLTCNESEIQLLVVKPDIFSLTGTRDKLLPILGGDNYAALVSALKDELAPDAEKFPTKDHMTLIVNTIETIGKAKAKGKIEPATYNVAVGISAAIMSVLYDDYAEFMPEGESDPSWEEQAEAILAALVGEEPAAAADPAEAAAAIAGANGKPVETAKSAAEQTGPKGTQPATKATVETNLPATEAQLTGNATVNRIVQSIKQRQQSLAETEADLAKVEEILGNIRKRQAADQAAMVGDVVAFAEALEAGKSVDEAAATVAANAEEEPAM